MKRSDFLRKLGIGIGAVVVAPRVLAEIPVKDKNADIIEWTKATFKPVYRRKDTSKGFEMSNGRFVGYVFYDKEGKPHITYL